ncbi:MULTISPECIES: hypothetical protein [unclassified Sphingomonas]|uniref:hypothetical protein n=1 Tax=unclassified Sphingomonas TaxID=196159 RepID=UPI00226A3261|nr:MULTISPECIES: hypothetical protein [unclassified Sphingomonas]
MSKNNVIKLATASRSPKSHKSAPTVDLPFDLEAGGVAIAAMDIAVSWLTAASIPFKVAAPHQIKIGNLSYYPNTGSFNLDRRPKEPGQGLSALKRYLETATGKRLPPAP